MTAFFLLKTPLPGSYLLRLMSMSVIIEMRKEYYSVPENKVARDTIGHSMAELCPGIVQGFQRGYFYVFASYQEVWY